MKFTEYLNEKDKSLTIFTNLKKGEVLYNRTGTIISIDFSSETVQVDFGSGDKYGISFSRLRTYNGKTEIYK